jgi:hypothetical protein
MNRPKNVHAPVGLDIGCDTPASIALSIAADIQASISQRDGRSLMLREGAIHSQSFEVGRVPLQTRSAASRPSYCETMVGNNVL